MLILRLRMAVVVLPFTVLRPVLGSCRGCWLAVCRVAVEA
jgi:hypothetical protein